MALEYQKGDHTEDRAASPPNPVWYLIPGLLTFASYEHAVTYGLLILIRPAQVSPKQ